MSLTITGRQAGLVGLGMMGLNNPARMPKQEDAIAAMKAALDAGSNCWHTGYIYSTPDHNSLHLLRMYFTKYPEDSEKVIVSVKACFNLATRSAQNDPEGVHSAITTCLAILDGNCRINIFQPCRIDPEIPVEVTVAAIAEFVAAGQIGGIGLSDCSAATIRKAVTAHPIAAVEVVASLFSTTIFTNGIVDVLEIPIFAYSPLHIGKGFLPGGLRKWGDMPDNGHCRLSPRFQPDVLDNNLKLVDEVGKIAKKKECTVAQVASSWLTAQSSTAGTQIIPIPGGSSVSRVEESIQLMILIKAKLKGIDEVLTKIQVKGERSPAAFQKFLEV